MQGKCDNEVPLTAVDQYMCEVKGLPPLAEGEEGLLLQQLRSDSSSAGAARARLTEGYQPLVVSLARRYAWRCTHLTFLDLVQDGNIGLLEAIDWHDGRAAGLAFRSWAFSWVRGRMLQAIWRDERFIRLPMGKVKQLRKLVGVQRDLLSRNGREPSLDELVCAMGVPLLHLLELLALQAQQVVSIHSFPSDSSSLDEMMAADETSTEDGLSALLRKEVKRLPEREQTIINLRYGLSDGIERTHKEVSALVGLAQSAVEDIDRHVRIRLRRALSRAGSQDEYEVA